VTSGSFEDTISGVKYNVDAGGEALQNLVRYALAAYP
jgi:hypothetical protein